MKNLYTRLFILVIISFIMCSCDRRMNKDLAPTPNAYENVVPEMWKHFQKFEIEAAKRGVTIDLRALKIEGVIRPVHVDGIAGLCSHNPETEKTVILDINFWSKSSDMEREAIIFHELGHCVLERSHNDDALDNGMCESLMRSGTSACITFYKYSDHQDYYLDELFSE